MTVDPFEEAAPAPEPAWKLQAIEALAEELGISEKAARAHYTNTLSLPSWDDMADWDGYIS